MTADATTLRQAARHYGVKPYVVLVLVDGNGIPTFPHEMNGKARCLDRDGMARLGKLVADYRRNRETQLASA